MAFPESDAHAKRTTAFWKGAPMFTQGRTLDAVHVKTKYMAVIEDLSETALPETVQDETYVDPADKHQQLGQDAYCKLITAATNGVNIGDNNDAVFVDLHPDVGDCMKAILTSHHQYYYFGLCKDDLHLDWLTNAFAEHATQLIKEGKLSINHFKVSMSTTPAQSFLLWFVCHKMA